MRFWRHVFTAAEMQGRQLGRRRVSLLIVVALPVALYLSQDASSPENAIGFGALGVAWALATTSLFAALSARESEPRLILAGYRSAELLLGRLLVLLLGGFLLCALAAVAMGIISKPVSEGDMLAACALVAVISVPLGLAVGAVLPTDLEGTLVIIGAVGVQLSLPQSSAANLALPLDAPIQFASLAGGFTGSAPGLMLLQATLYTAALILISILAWSRRVGRRRQVVIRAEGG
jgi:hypothetical protein